MPIIKQKLGRNKTKFHLNCAKGLKITKGKLFMFLGWTKPLLSMYMSLKR